MARLIDASVLIGMQRRGLTMDALGSLADPREEGAIAAVTVSELVRRVLRTEPGPRRRRRESFLDAVLDAIPVVPFDLRAALAYGRLLEDLRGHEIGAHDAQIASTALAHGYGVLTGNARHFERVPGLDVLQPRWPQH
jgi:tRNA(fMet)-specific endonuclease VapC